MGVSWNSRGGTATIDDGAYFIITTLALLPLRCLPLRRTSASVQPTLPLHLERAGNHVTCSVSVVTE